MYYLTNADLETKEGRELKKYLNYPSQQYYEDICGHGPIRHYYPELKYLGKDKEITDLSNPNNLPEEIVLLIKKGKLSEIGISSDLLNEEGKKKYEKIRQTAYAEFQKIRQTEFWKIFKNKKYRNPLWI